MGVQGCGGAGVLGAAGGGAGGEPHTPAAPPVEARVSSAQPARDGGRLPGPAAR